MGCSLCMVAPKARTPLAADALVPLIRRGCAPIPAPRGADGAMAFRAARMAACARFSLQAPALLACDTARAAGTVHTLYGMARVPCDTPRCSFRKSYASA